MRILYIHQYFKTPKEPGGTRSYWLAQELLKNGYDVTMLTTNKHQKEVINEYYADGIKVVSFGVFYNQSMGIKDRLKSFVDFMMKSTKYAFNHSKEYDFVFATSTPLTVGITPLLLKWFKGKKYVFEVRDLWPEVPIQMGAIKNPIIIWLTRLLEKTIYKNAEHVIALSPGMQEGVVKYIPKDNTTMIPNMSKIDEFWPREKNYELMEQIGLKSDYLKVIHFGSLGEANGIETILESAYLLSDHKIQFIFLGAGSTEERLKKIIEERKMENILFHGRMPMKLTSEIVNCCDVSLVSFKNLPILYTNSPNKLFDSLSAGKPIIVNSAGWTKDLVLDNKCGIYCDPNNFQDLADKLIYLNENRGVLDVMSFNSRSLAEKVYDKSILSRDFVRVIKSILK
ncbi:glycosyltransferase family 4 protein [Myroides odoratimimus]|uniref:glycosyltransferase family 4 protein n=1 Tax=Myroides odoratimimus TaxID=76832 RepID=UPI002576DE50|nr:glycosyltransferase family 4 protein [Myroides odoratimimus]MDM1527394.1 glycosyltransferase family 4 protein [Myroides odoratimimus]